MKKYAIALLAAAATLVVVAAASAANTTSNNLAYEFDNGTNWTLQQNTAALNTTYTNPSYSDVGIVVDLGQAKDFTGLTFEGTSNLQANIWLGDDPEAYTPGTHLLSATTLFSYGPWEQTFWTGDQVGQPVTTLHIQTLNTTEVYAWIGVVYTGSSVSGSVSAVNGKSVGNRTMSINNNGDGTITALIH